MTASEDPATSATHTAATPPGDTGAWPAAMPEAEPAARPARGRLRRGLLSRVSIKSKLIVMLLVSSIVSAAVVGLIGYESGRTSLRASVFDRLTQVRDSQSRQMQDKINDLRNSLIIYTRGSTTIDALGAFTAGFDQLATATINPAQQQQVSDHYSQFAKNTEQKTGNRLDPHALLPDSDAQKYLQAYYSAPVGSANNAIDLDARDGSAWTAANTRYNDFFREIVNRFGFNDALLIDGRGNVVYSAEKGVDLGTNLLTGPYRENNLRDAYEQTIASNAVDFVAVTDFQRYQPAGDAPTAWMVAPVGVDGRVDGALALQFPITGLNRLMTVDKQWQSTGLGKTGETYLAGPDDLMRSDSRLFLQNAEQYKRDAVEAGTAPDVVDQAVRLGGTMLVQPVDHRGPALRPARAERHADHLGLSRTPDAAGLCPGHPAQHRPALVDHRQDRHLRGVRAGVVVHPHPGAHFDRDRVRGLPRGHAARPAVRAADPQAGGRCPAHQPR